MVDGPGPLSEGSLTVEVVQRDDRGCGLDPGHVRLVAALLLSALLGPTPRDAVLLGAIAQATIANAYPGIYQGLLTMCAYPDALSTGAQFADLHMLRLYFEDPSKWALGVIWTEQQWADVEGHISHANAVAADEGFFKAATDPTNPCDGVSDDERYRPKRADRP